MGQNKNVKKRELLRIDIYDEIENKIIISLYPTKAGEKQAEKFKAYSYITIRRIYQD